MTRLDNTRFAVLGLLSLQPMSGYEVRKHVRQELTYFWSESFGQIYPALKKLTKEGLIEPAAASSGGRQRRVFRLTTAGRRILRDWLARPHRVQPPRNEFLLKLFLGNSAPAGACLAHLQRFRAEQQHLLDMFAIIRDSVRTEHVHSPHLTYCLLMLDHGIATRRAELGWCDHALTVLELLTGRFRLDRNWPFTSIQFPASLVQQHAALEARTRKSEVETRADLRADPRKDSRPAASSR